MQTRTRLTSPTGQEPVTEIRRDLEPFSPGLALPHEPRVPGRYRRLWVSVVVALAVVLGGIGAFRVATSGQTFDPSLDTDSIPGEP